MEKRRYSIQDVQDITKLSPTALQEFITRFRKYFSIETEESPDGPKVYLDQISLERLMFIKNLETNQSQSKEEALCQIRTSKGRSGVPERKSLAGILVNFLDSLTVEIKNIENNMNQILHRYVQVLKDLNQCRSENRQMRKEMDQLKKRQEKILLQLREQDDEAILEQKPRRDQIN
ncbi:MAG TPA: hypothetical protein PKO06_19995 [Candidatus Ozemobacteraceae bacterium]|nr:hypothetical protein [Candidatus Ozemobacteraceae bacterium]